MRLHKQKYHRGNTTVQSKGYWLTVNACMIRLMFFSSFYIHSKEFGLCLQWLHYELVIPEVYMLINFLSATTSPIVLFGNSMFEIVRYDNGITIPRKVKRYDSARF